MTERVPWQTLKNDILPRWDQGQHVHVSGRTGQGKTRLMRELYPRRSHVIVFGTKFVDSEYTAMLRDGFTRVVDGQIPRFVNKALVWPVSKPGEGVKAAVARQREIFAPIIDKTWKQGWSYSWEELHWMTEELGFDDEIKAAHHAGRSMGITNIDGMQRAMRVPVIVHGSASHVFMFRQTEESDLKRMSGLGKMPTAQLRAFNDELGNHEFVYMSDRTDPVISKVGT